MIYTVTLNPSVDYIIKMDNLKEGHMNYSDSDYTNAGGRALNVSRVLRTMDVPSTATGFIGGRTGDFIEDELDKVGILHDFIRTKHDTRINVSVIDGAIETRLISKGGEISLDEVNELMYYLSRVREGDFMVIAGSLPPNLSPEIYQRMVEIAVVNGAAFIPAIKADYLSPLLSKKPLLLTPSLKELSEIYETDLLNKEDAARAAIDLINAGAENVIVTMEREGSIYVNKNLQVFEADGPKHTVVSQTYITMSLVAGFIGNYMRTNDPKQAFAAAQGASNAAYYVHRIPDVEAIRQAIEEVTVLPFS